jgi:uncharacterized membrane protein YdcZ (DUF606 family)
MDWNKEVIKGPMPKWVIILCAILSGCFVSYMVNRDIKSDVPETARIIVCFILGAAGFLCQRLIYKLAKNPTPWLRRNFRLIVTIGGLISALVILWGMLSKK